MKTFLCVLALLSGTAVVQAAPVAEPVAAPVVAEPLVEKDGLKISIPTTQSAFYINGVAGVFAQYLRLRSTNPCVPVILQNTSAKPIYVLGEDCEDGFNSLTLEVTEYWGQDKYQPIVVSRKPMKPQPNSRQPYFEIILPGEMIMREIHLPCADRTEDEAHEPFDLYDNYPFRGHNGGQSAFNVRAVFSIQTLINLADTGNEPVFGWTGKVASKLQSCLISWR